MLADAMSIQDARITPPGGTTNAPPSPVGTFPTEQARAEAAVVKFKSTADAYPSTDAGLFARYRQATLLNTLNRPGEAIVVYQELVRRAGEGIYGQMATARPCRSAGARRAVRSGDQRASRRLAQRKDGPLPVDGVLMQLGGTYLDAGKRADAQQTFNRTRRGVPGVAVHRGGAASSSRPA